MKTDFNALKYYYWVQISQITNKYEDRLQRLEKLLLGADFPDNEF